MNHKLALGFVSLALLLQPIPAKAELLKIQPVTSTSGITAWLVEDHTVPVISLKFAFKGAGARNDSEAQQGLSQLLSNTLDEGAGDLDSTTFQKKLSDNSISLSFDSDRDDFTGNLKTLSKNKAVAFDLMRLALSAPRFEDEAVKRMIDANITRLKNDMTDPEWQTARLMNSVLYKGHPYAQNSGGTLTSLKSLNAQSLRQKWKNDFNRSRLVVSAAGDITQEELKTALDEIFKDLPQGEAAKAVTPSAFPPAQTVFYDKEIPQTLIQIAMPGIRRDADGYFAAEVLNFVYGGSGFGSRLTDSIREKHGLTYGIYSSFVEMDGAESLMIGTSTKNETSQQMLDMIKAETLNLLQSGITDKELNDAKAYLTGAVPLGLTSTDKIANALLGLQRDNLGADYLDKREKAIKSLKKEDVNKLSAKLLNWDKAVTVILGKPANLPQNTQTITAIPNVE